MTDPQGREPAALDLDAIEARANAATPGPWVWRGNVDNSCPSLRARGQDVLGTVRRERTADDPGAKDYARYLRDTQREDGNGGWRSPTEDEITAEVEAEWLNDQWGTPQTDTWLGFVTDLMYVYARDLAIFEVCPEATDRNDPRVYRADIAGIRHPDAEFIAHARADIDALIAEVRRLRHEGAEERTEWGVKWLDTGVTDSWGIDSEGAASSVRFWSDPSQAAVTRPATLLQRTVFVGPWTVSEGKP